MSRLGIQLNVRVKEHLRQQVSEAADRFGTVTNVIESALLHFLNKDKLEQLQIVEEAQRQLRLLSESNNEPGPTASDRTTV